MRPKVPVRMPELVSLVERVPRSRLVAAGLAAVALPLVGAVAADGWLVGACVAMAALGAAGLGWAAMVRNRAEALPLVVADTAVAESFEGAPAYRFRVRLGHGRVVAASRATVRFRSPAGAIELAVVEPQGPRVGPWSIVAMDPASRCAAGGVLELRVEADERGRRWSATAEFPLEVMRPGRFAPMARVERGRLRWAGEWDRVAE